MSARKERGVLQSLFETVDKSSVKLVLMSHLATELIDLALAQREFSGMSKVLRLVAERLDAQACVLWQLPSTRHASDQAQVLFVLAEWSQECACAIHDLPYDGSITGEAIKSGVSRHVPDVEQEPYGIIATQFLRENKIRRFVSVPIRVGAEFVGALNLYRRDGAKPFELAELQTHEEIAPLVFSIYRLLVSQVSGVILKQLDGLLRRIDRDIDGVEIGLPEGAGRALCALITRHFRCLGCNLRLQSPEPLEANDWLVEDSAEAPLPNLLSHGDLLTSRHSFDLRGDPVFDDVSPTFADRLATMREASSSAPENGNPARRIPKSSPLAYMRVPILGATGSLGAIECFVATKSPYLISALEVETLAGAAGLLGCWWEALVAKRAVARENRFWLAFADIINDLNTSAHEEASKTASNIRSLRDNCLTKLAPLLKAQALYIYWAEEGQLCLKARAGQSRSDVATAIPLSGNSLVADVFRHSRSLAVLRESDIPSSCRADGAALPQVLATIGLGSERVGVLEARWSEIALVPTQAQHAVRLVGEQLGLFHQVIETVARFRQAERDAQSATRQRTQVFEVLSHQLRSPVRQLYSRLKDVLAMRLGEAEERELRRIKGLARKVQRVTADVRYYAALAEGHSIRPQLRAIDAGTLTRALIEAAADAEVVADPDRRLRIRVDRDAIATLARQRVLADPDLLAQAISNLLDNAVKYSYSGSEIRVYGGLAPDGRIQVGVQNTGTPIGLEEATRLRERGTRGQRAFEQAAEGSGLGLWVVDNVMRAQGGQLVIVPTSRQTEGAEQINEVQLLFRIA